MRIIVGFVLVLGPVVGLIAATFGLMAGCQNWNGVIGLAAFLGLPTAMFAGTFLLVNAQEKK